MICRGLPKYQHTAHDGAFRKVCYRYHPLFGSEVRVLRRFPKVSAGSVLVVLPDETHGAIPEWMLDPVACAGLTDEPSPRISLGALRELRALLDSQSLSSSPPSVSTGPSPNGKGGRHAPRESAADAASDGRERALGSASRAEPEEVPGDPEPSPSHGRHRGGKRRGGGR